MVLVDTSVWIDHLRAGEPRLAALLEQTGVVMHPMVLGELACGNVKYRAAMLGLWQGLPRLGAATQAAALDFLEQYRLWGRGLGFIDVHLLVSAAQREGTTLWTRDKRLHQAASELHLAFAEPATCEPTKSEDDTPDSPDPSDHA
jgi:predicted nucleic acid-binding protein